MTQNIKLKRIYDDPSPDDGLRILVDRLWPRGISKERAQLDDWLPKVAPSADLRTWFGHDPKKWEEFSSRYEAELADNEASEALRDLIADHKVTTLLYAAKDTEHNHALVLRDLLER